MASASAAENLTPVALELGGETGNWCIVRKDADIRDAARKIAFFKLCNAGKLRYSPTVIYPVDINESIVQKELFCPLLPVVPFKDSEVDAVLDVVADREHPYREKRILPLLRLLER